MLTAIRPCGIFTVTPFHSYFIFHDQFSSQGYFDQVKQLTLLLDSYPAFPPVPFEAYSCRSLPRYHYTSHKFSVHSFASDFITVLINVNLWPL